MLFSDNRVVIFFFFWAQKAIYSKKKILILKMHNLHYGSSSNGNNNNNVEWMFRSASLRTHWEWLLSLSVLSGDNETMIPFGLRSANTAEWNWLKLLCYRGCYFYSFVRFSGSRFSASWIQNNDYCGFIWVEKIQINKGP